MLSWIIKLFGSGGTWKWIALTAMAAVVAGLMWSRTSLKAKLAEARTEIVAAQADRAQALAAYESAEAALAELKEIDAAKDQALAERAVETKRIAAERNKFQRAWKEALQHEEVRSWADTPVPADVRGLLR